MKAMEHHTEPPIIGAIITILLASGTWFLNFVTDVDSVAQLVLHIVQIFAALGAILAAGCTIYPPLKDKIRKLIK